MRTYRRLKFSVFDLRLNIAIPMTTVPPIAAGFTDGVYTGYGLGYT